MSAAPPDTRWAHHTSVFQPRRPAFYVFGALLVLTGLLSVAEQQFFLARAPAGLVLSWILLACYLLPVGLLVYRLDLYEREPVSLVLAALAWGAVAATTFAGLANQGWGVVVLNVAGPHTAAQWSAALTAPFVEEIVKGAGIVLLYQIAPYEFDDVLDGFVYGAMVGLGFAVVEDVFYFMVVFGGSVSGVVAGFFLRVIASGLYGHVLYSGLVGMGIAYFVTARAARAQRIAVAGLLAGVAVAAHFVWNAPLFDYLPDQIETAGDFFVCIPLALAVKGMPLLVLVVITVELERERQTRVFRDLIGPEIDGPAVTPAEARSLESLRSRRRVARDAKRRAGRRAARLVRRLQREQVSLALLRARLHDDDHDDVVSQRLRCVQVRERLEEALRGPTR